MDEKDKVVPGEEQGGAENMPEETKTEGTPGEGTNA